MESKYLCWSPTPYFINQTNLGFQGYHMSFGKKKSSYTRENKVGYLLFFNA